MTGCACTRVLTEPVGVSVKTLENWEQGRRQQLGPAGALVTVLVADSDVVKLALR